MAPKDRKPIDWNRPISKMDVNGLVDHLDKIGRLFLISGHIGTPHGYVVVAYRNWTDKSLLELSMIVDGIYYGRNLFGPISRRTIVTLANRFAAEITGEDKHE